ncbi:poly polymerase [Trichonephila clavipes]|nr:poly polymerase [Trichonephila clavipes]
MIPAYNKKRCAAFPFETGIHFRRKTDFLPEEDTTKSYSGFEPEPTGLQAEGSNFFQEKRCATKVSKDKIFYSPFYMMPLGILQGQRNPDKEDIT